MTHLQWVEFIGFLVTVIVGCYILRPGKEDHIKPPQRSIRPVDLGASFEQFVYGLPAIGKTYVSDKGSLMIPLDQVKALTNSAFIAGASVYEPEAEYRWTYQEWEKENLP